MGGIKKNYQIESVTSVQITQNHEKLWPTAPMAFMRVSACSYSSAIRRRSWICVIILALKSIRANGALLSTEIASFSKYFSYGTFSRESDARMQNNVKCHQIQAKKNYLETNITFKWNFTGFRAKQSLKSRNFHLDYDEISSEVETFSIENVCVFKWKLIPAWAISRQPLRGSLEIQITHTWKADIFAWKEHCFTLK